MELDPATKRIERLESKLRLLQILTGMLSALMVGVVALYWTQASREPTELVAQKLTIVDGHGKPWFAVSLDGATGRREMVLRDNAGRRRAALAVVSAQEAAEGGVAAGTVAFGLYSAQESAEGDGLSMASVSVGPTGNPSLSLSARNSKARFGVEVSPDFGGAGLVGTDMDGRRTLRLPAFGTANW